MNEGKPILSAEFRKIRDEVFNLSMEAFAARIGISKNRVNDIENAPGGVVGVSRDTINSLATEMNITAAELLLRLSPPAGPAKQTKKAAKPRKGK